jgi:putative ABC transport system permease protein
MNLRESGGMALAALRANKLRSLLTLLGTIIGVMSVIAVLSFVEGLNRFVSEKLLASGSNVFYVDKYGFITSQEAFEEVRDRPDITVDDADALRAGVTHASLVIAQGNDQVMVKYKNKDMKGVSLRGRSAGFEQVDDYQIGAGRFYTDLDDQRRRPVVVLGPEVSEELFGSLDPIGRQVRLGADTYEVIGVTAAKGKLLGQSQIASPRFPCGASSRLGSSAAPSTSRSRATTRRPCRSLSRKSATCCAPAGICARASRTTSGSRPPRT